MDAFDTDDVAVAVAVATARWLTGALGDGCEGRLVGTPTWSMGDHWRVEADVSSRDPAACMAGLRFPAAIGGGPFARALVMVYPVTRRRPSSSTALRHID